MHYEKTSDEKFFYLFYRSEHDGSSEPTFTAPHCHGAYELLVVTRGSVEAVLNGEVKTVTAGEVLFMDSYDIHSSVFENCERYSLVFTKEYCRILAARDTTLPSHMKFTEKTFQKIKSILDEYYREYGERIPNGLLVEGLVSYILGLAESEHGRVEKREKPGELMIEVLEYIKKNADSDLTIANLAAKFGYTPNYFSSLFNKFVQMSFNDYLNYVRYTRAAEIIQLQGCTATNIAMKCGFGSMNTFYRAKNKFDKKS